MDIREIEALHAQYASQPIVIDITGHVKAMSALPAPSRSASDRSRAARITRYGRIAKPALIAFAVAMVVGAGGMSAAKLWRAMHTPAPHAAVAVVPPRPDSAQGAPVSPRPLTSADPAGEGKPVAEGMAKVDPRELAAHSSEAPAVAPKAAPSPASDVEQAEASPIRVPRRAAPAQASNGAAAAPATPQPQTQVNRAPVRPQPDTESTAQLPAPHPVRHIAPRRHVAPKAQPDAAAAPAAAPAPTSKAPAAAKSGDVQIF